MDEFDKVEKLRQRADVSFEEARDALRACDGDLLDAMVYLEKLGRVKAPEKEVFSTDADKKEEYHNVNEVIEENERSVDPSFGEQLGHLLKTAFRKSVDNFLAVSYKGEERFRVPILVVILALLMFNVGAVIAIVISLFFDVRYSFVGKDDLSKVNDVMNQAGAKATEWMNTSYKKEQASVKQEPESQSEKQRRREERYAEKAERRAEHWEKKAKQWEERAEKKYGKGKDEKEENTVDQGPLETFSKQEVDELAKKYDEDDKSGK